ncbi:hypothetical protein MUK42_10661 [Musa troglodytarum]|uniref:Uncharacterized protein n=1 Tax=Musa troglodytarum TaxID=320322 RepID=A0A9E7JJ45_9LILI|nr:hypothetical protein MUK42_10661 [Musa troglodytarum]
MFMNTRTCSGCSTQPACSCVSVATRGCEHRSPSPAFGRSVFLVCRTARVDARRHFTATQYASSLMLTIICRDSMSTNLMRRRG